MLEDQNKNETPINLEDTSLFYKIGCLLIPILGYVSFFIFKYQKKPVKAKSVLIAAIIGTITNIIVNVIYMYRNHSFPF